MHLRKGMCLPQQWRHRITPSDFGEVLTRFTQGEPSGILNLLLVTGDCSVACHQSQIVCGADSNVAAVRVGVRFDRHKYTFPVREELHCRVIEPRLFFQFSTRARKRTSVIRTFQRSLRRSIAFPPRSLNQEILNDSTGGTPKCNDATFSSNLHTASSKHCVGLWCLRKARQCKSFHTSSQFMIWRQVKGSRLPSVFTGVTCQRIK